MSRPPRSHIPESVPHSNLAVSTKHDPLASPPVVDPTLETQLDRKRCMPYDSQNSSTTTLLQTAPSSRPHKKARYYQSALSEEDKKALSQGHHDSRRALIPECIGEVRKTEILAQIEQDKERSLQAFRKKKASQSMLDLRLTPPYPVSPDCTPKSKNFSWDATPESMKSRPSTSNDYFTLPKRPRSAFLPNESHSRSSSGNSSRSVPQTIQPYPHPRPSEDAYPDSPRQSLQLPSPTSSGASTRVRSPLSNEVSLHRHNPAMTFDAFLVPHKSGKGEAYVGSENARKDKKSKFRRAPTTEGDGSPISKKRLRDFF